MAYLNCPFCPSQAYLARDREHSDIPPLEKYRCGSGKHTFYVEEKDVNEQVNSSNVVIRYNNDQGGSQRTQQRKT